MADYLVTGKKGNGKGLFAVEIILNALKHGKRVATNLNIFLDKLDPYSHKFYMRLPDVVTASDLYMLGRGQDGVVEEDNGIMIIDESSKNLGARDWADKDRAALLDWVVHSRKHGWDVYFIAQGASQLDKVLRNTQIEYHVSTMRTDKWRFPIIGPLGKLRASGKPFTFPRVNIATVRQGFHQGAMVCDRIYYRGRGYYDLYETQQIFLNRDHPDAVGLHSVLSPWLTTGRYLPAPLSGFGALLALFNQFLSARSARPVALKPKHPLVERVMRLPSPAQRIEFLRRFEQCGALR